MERSMLFHKVRNLTPYGKMVQFDFAQPEYQECFIEELGGEEKLKSDFPQLYRHFKEAIIRDKNCDGGSEQMDGTGFGNMVDIFYGFYNMEEKRVKGRAVTSLVRDMKSISHRLCVYQEDGKEIFEMGGLIPDSHHAVLEADHDAPWKDCGLHKTLIFQYFSTWIDYETGLHAAYYSAEDQCTWNTSGYVKSLTMKDPGHKNTPANGPIIVCYDRQVSGNTVDYDYASAFQGGRQKLFLDVAGNVELKQEAGSFTMISKSGCELKLDCQKGGAVYRGEWDNRFTKNDKGFSFKLDQDWKDVVPSERLPLKDNIDFSLKLSFHTEKTRNNTVYVASNSTISGVYPISSLQLLWGCIAPDTPVLMADGSYKLAKNIKMGDKTALEEGTGTVKAIYTGREAKPSVCIETANGRRFCCTKEHPVLTKRGFLTAGELNGADLIKDMEDGFVSIIMIYPVNLPEVLNFDIEPEEGKHAVLICDGLVTGDNAMQKSCMDELEERKQAKKNRVPDEELLRLKAFFEGK